jgi:hypothetical protein
MMMKTYVCASAYEHAENPCQTWSYQEELPPNICKRRGRCLQIDEVGQGDGGNRKGDALGAEMVGEDLAVEHNAGNIYAAAIKKKKDVAVPPINKLFLGNGMG